MNEKAASEARIEHLSSVVRRSVVTRQSSILSTIFPRHESPFPFCCYSQFHLQDNEAACNDPGTKLGIFALLTLELARSCTSSTRTLRRNYFLSDVIPFKQ